MENLFDEYRNFLKDTIRQRIDFRLTDQNKGIAPPPIQIPYSADSFRIDLVAKENWHNVASPDLISVIQNRRSHRHFKAAPISLEDLSFLLWATQGITTTRDKTAAFRTVPSAGCRHALETYLCILNIAGLETGIYRYLPVEHELLLVSKNKNLADDIVTATFYQSFIGKAPVTFIWTAVPYRMEWRYHLAAHKVIAIDAGHVCQNLYLASAAIGAGTCAVAAYHQEILDQLLGVDGKDEFAIYLAAVGKI
ncbi:MAG: thioester oxidase [Nitrospira bacterium SM23_35]|jgi:SagB-type dehydrogenase family enzyme|nr:MAG: thioester oxidase [Nitrospira bacterium SM23_35]